MTSAAKAEALSLVLPEVDEHCSPPVGAPAAWDGAG